MTRIDVRLVPLAATVWLTAALLVGRTVPALVVAGVAALAAAATLARERRRRARRAGRTALPGVVLCLVGALAVAGVVAADARGARSQLLAEAAHAGTRLTVEVRVAAEPRAFTSAWEGPTRYAVDVHVDRVQAPAARGGVLTEDVALPATLVGTRWQDVVVGERVAATVAVAARGHDGRRARYDLRGATTPRPLATASAPRRVAHHLRAGLREAVAELPPDAAGLVPGIAVGDTSALPADLVDAMRTTGLTHLTAVSGAHFSLVGALVLAATAALRARRVVRVVVTVVVLAGLVVLVGPDPSVLRAASTGAIGLLALAAGRRGAAVPALAGGVVVLLLLDPWLARSAGLALSVAATAGLVVGGPLVLGRLHGARRWLAAALAAPALAQLACAPVLVLLEPRLATWALPANVVAAPAVAPATVLGLVTTVVAPVSPGVAGWLAGGAGHAAGWIAGTARTVAAWPGASLPWLPGPAGAGLLVLLEAVIVTLVVLRVRRARGVGGSWDP